MTTVAWIDGQVRHGPAAVVAVTDPGLLHGIGVFETTRVHDGVPFAMTRHLQRLRRGAATVGIEVPWDDEALREAASTAVRATVAEVGGPLPHDTFLRLRLTVTGGGALVATVAVADEWPTSAVAVTTDRPINERSPTAGVKVTSRIDGVLVLAEAHRLGADEAIRSNTVGRLCEGTAANVFLVVDGVLCTPSLATGCLRGVTRELVCEAVEAVERDDLTFAELARASEVFLTSATRGVHPVGMLDGAPLVTGPVTMATAAAYDELVLASLDP
ncbi:MAG: aminotransferase class IV [Aquihabitans sp.]